MTLSVTIHLRNVTTFCLCVSGCLCVFFCLCMVECFCVCVREIVCVCVCVFCLPVCVSQCVGPYHVRYSLLRP